jgi:S-DNA-T family DNA segregation ATPase FtsK/SpoIIIE
MAKSGRTGRSLPVTVVARYAADARTSKKDKTHVAKTLTSKAKPKTAGSAYRKPVSRQKPAARKTYRSTARKTSRSKTTSAWDGLTREQKLDIGGAFIALLGLISFVTLFSKEATLAVWWAGLWFQLVGWGAYYFSLALMVLGLWLLISRSEKIPPLSAGRVAGILLLMFNVLLWISLVVSTLPAESVSNSGGILGAFMRQLLVNSLGMAATVVFLLAWLVIGIAFAFDISLVDFYHNLKPFARKIGHTAQGVIQDWRQAAAEDEEEVKMIPPEPPAKLPDSYQPIQPFSGPAAGSSAAAKTYLTEKSAPAKPGDLKEKESKSADGNSAQIGLPAVVRSRPAANWKLPNLKDILDPATPAAQQETVDVEIARLLEDTLASFGAPGHVVDIKHGPTVTQYGIEPDFLETRQGKTRVRVSKISALADDLALALAAPSIRIQAPVPGKSFVGIEVPNRETSRVTLMEVIESAQFKRLQSRLRFALGKDVSGKPNTVDLARMPHLLIAGTTGAGKSVCVNSILSSLLLYNTPAELRLVLVDPKRVELTGYNGIPHLLDKVVTEAEMVINALQWITQQMDGRYHKFSKTGVRNIEEFNNKHPDQYLPYIVVVIDELADLMMLAPDETERAITRLAQLARATGIHLVLATQRPSTDVVTGLIKANFPARIAFAVASGVDSRVILDQPGAERLLGRGDMLFQAPDAPAPVRLQGVYVSDGETRRLVDYWRSATAMQTASSGYSPNGGEPEADDLPPISQELPVGVPLKQTSLWEEAAEESDPVYDEAVDLVRREGRASVTMLQRRMRIGYTRAARLIDRMEEKGIISGRLPDTQTREVIDYGPTAPPQDDGY